MTAKLILPSLALLAAAAIGLVTLSTQRSDAQPAQAANSNPTYIIKVGDSYVNAAHITHIYPWHAGNDQHHVLRVEFDTAISTEIDAQDFTGKEETQLRAALDAIAH